MWYIRRISGIEGEGDFETFNIHSFYKNLSQITNLDIFILRTHLKLNFGLWLGNAKSYLIVVVAAAIITRSRHIFELLDSFIMRASWLT